MIVGGLRMNLKEKLRDETLDSIKHSCEAFTKVFDNSGKDKVFNFPETHKIANGLYLSIWTKWEEFCRQLLILELAENPDSVLRKRVKEFRSKKSAILLAKRVTEHLDHPNNFNTWHDFETLLKRARKLVGDDNAFKRSQINKSELKYIFKIRNAIAHASDKAKSDFLSLLARPPFNLTPQQKQGISTGRLLCTRGVLNPKKKNETVLISIANIIKKNVKLLVP